MSRAAGGASRAARTGCGGRAPPAGSGPQSSRRSTEIGEGEFVCRMDASRPTYLLQEAARSVSAHAFVQTVAR